MNVPHAAAESWLTRTTAPFAVKRRKLGIYEGTFFQILLVSWHSAARTGGV